MHILERNQDMTTRPPRVALITGGGTGIGRAVALAFAKSGVNLVINYSRSCIEAEETQEAARALGVEALVVRADVSRDSEVRAMVGRTLQNFDRLDILVNSAGVTDYVVLSDLEGLTDAHWNRVWEVNVKGLFYSCRAAAPALRASGGCIVNINSVAGVIGIGSSIAYAASKAAAMNVTRSLARVLAPEVRVNGVAPSVVQTRWVEGHDEHVERAREGTPLERVASPEEVAQTVYALAFHSPFLTGQNIILDGGKFIGV